jgi:thiosulfate/3-mercaptopyruvate sulfurtransferase
LSGEAAVFYEDALNSGYDRVPRLLPADLAGLPKIKVLNGGFSAWKAAGLAVSTEAQ